MSIHIEAKKGAIAETVLLPGDPMRAKWIAETFLENAFCYNDVRGMYGYTGTYKGKRVSVQGTGMGIPSAMIYCNELIKDYGVKNLIRVGSAGSYQKEVRIRDIVIAMAASTTSGINNSRFINSDFSPTADFDLFLKAVDYARKKISLLRQAMYYLQMNFTKMILIPIKNGPILACFVLKWKPQAYIQLRLNIK